jgi:hypothetical protein
MGRNKDYNINGSPAWHAWLGRVSRLARISRAALIDVALAEKAEREGWPTPPPRLADEQAEPNIED